MPTQTVISINRQTPIMGPATFYPRVVVERLPSATTAFAKEGLFCHQSFSEVSAARFGELFRE